MGSTMMSDMRSIINSMLRATTTVLSSAVTRISVHASVARKSLSSIGTTSANFIVLEDSERRQSYQRFLSMCNKMFGIFFYSDSQGTVRHVSIIHKSHLSKASRSGRFPLEISLSPSRNCILVIKLEVSLL